jgi:prepilin-type N-terminal cleavage/methylation domain-containing protein
MRPQPTSSRRAKAAFTLLEVMVSTAVLAMLISLSLMLISSFSEIYSAGKEFSRTHAAARIAVSVLARDLEQAILRGDLPANAYGLDAAKQPQDRSGCFFLTRRESLPDAGVTTSRDNPARAISRVGYHLADDGNLIRSSTGLAFRSSIFSAATLNALAPVEYALTDGCVDFRVQFMNSTGNITPGFEPSTATTPGTCAATVSLAFADEKSFIIKKASLASFITSLRGKLNTRSPKPTETYADVWREEIEKGNLFDGEPAPLRRGLKVFSVRVPIENHPQ